MHQFDVFANPDAQLRRLFPFVVCLQAQTVAALPTQIVAPLVQRDSLPGAAGRIAPVVTIDRQEYVTLVPRLTAVPTRVLKTRAGNLAAHRDDLLAAVDLVFYGV